MIELTDIDGRSHFVAAEHIVRITEAGPSSQWHGIKSFVRLADGKCLEVRQTPSEIAGKVRRDLAGR